MENAKLRVGLVGANWGLTHVAAWQSVPDVDLVAICTSTDQTAEAAAKANNIPNAFGDFDRMMAEMDLDIVDITPRPTIRVPYALKALEAGKHVIQPMPFALDLSQGRRLHDLAQAKKAIAVVENLHRHSPTFRQAKSLIDEGAIGEVQSFKAFVRTNILLEPAPGFPYLWLVDQNSGASALRNFGAQALHILYWFFGEVADVAAQISTKVAAVQVGDQPAVPNGTTDSASLLLGYDGKIDGMLDISWCLYGQNAFSLDIAGSRGRLLIEAEGLGPRSAVLSLTTKAREPVQPIDIDLRFRQGSTVPNRDDTLESLAFMCQRMATAITEQAPELAEPDFTEALHVMEVVEAAYEAAESRSWVNLGQYRGSLDPVG